MAKIEDFPISKNVADKAIEAAKSKYSENRNSDKYVYLNFSMVRMQAAWIVPKLTYAKGIADKLGAHLVVITWRDNPELERFFAAYGAEMVSLHTMMNAHKGYIFKSIFKTASFMTFKGKGEDVKKIELCGIKAGKSLYEDIIRTSSLSTIRSARNKIVLKKMLHIYWMIFGLDDYLKKHKPVVCVADDICYHEGIILRLMKNHGAKVYASNGQWERQVNIDNEDRIETIASLSHDYYASKLDEAGSDYAAWSDEYLQQRFAGKNGRAIDRGAFAGKKVITREEAVKTYGLDENKKTVVIMAHTFTDGIYNYGELYFRDYYDWLEKTLMIASKIDTVNWVLKPHPTRGAYNESTDSIEMMFDRYKTDNMHILSDDVSAESILNFADIQITIGGTSGGEFACFGIPAVIVGKPFYYGFGYTIEPPTYDEYVKTLENIHDVKPLDEKQTDMAKKLFYLKNNTNIPQPMYKYDDDFANVVNGEYSKMIEAMALEYFASNDGTKKFNDQALNVIAEYTKSHDMTENAYYKRGQYRAERI